ncbi:MAG: PIN domain-containing protein [Proteobacteria bacterium]|nr:PIN domain-containing protein [Pseudomonadota bacterium]
MKTYVIDASIAVKWYSATGEDDLARADKLLQNYVDGSCEFIAPKLISYELANALRFNPNFKAGDVKRAMTDFFDLQITLKDPVEYMNSAIDLAFKYSLTVYDAVYAALSQIVGVPLITADYKFYAKAKALPFIEALKDLEI